MSHYDDEAQIEQLRRWWRENWVALAAGLLLGLGGIYGWEAWQSYSDRKAEEASRLFEDLKAASARPEEAAKLGETLLREFGSTPYAPHAALLLAQRAAAAGDWDAARSRLDWVLAHAGDPGLVKLARLRLARVLWQQGDAEAALRQLDIEDSDAFAPLYQELRGDIHFSGGDREAAGVAYRKAMELGPAPAAREFLQHKLDDLAGEDS